MKRDRRHLVILLFMSLALLIVTPTSAGPLDGAVAGVVFHDLNGDGVRDTGEPGLSNRLVQLGQLDVIHASTNSERDGTYLLGDIQPDDYILISVLDARIALCGEGPFSFSPIPTSFCLDARLPWHATDIPGMVTVDPGMTLQVDIGAQPDDVAVVNGVALLENEYASSGTFIEALVGDKVCGTTSLKLDGGSSGNDLFELHILGAGEQAACAQPGDEVRFRVGGVLADETYLWVPFTDAQSSVGIQVQHLSAMEQHAWYWLEASADDLPEADTVVQAQVDGVVCGETTIDVVGGFIAGFSRLIVPSETIQPGCGRPGATVSFMVGGVAAKTTVAWEPGLQRIDLDVPEQPVSVPELGLSQAEGSSQASFLLIAVLIGSGTLLTGGGLVVARHR